MTVRTIDPEILNRPLKQVVESPRARAALERHGFKTLGDVRNKGIGSLHGLAGIGEGTINVIEKALGPVPVEDADDANVIEEGPHPIRLESPYSEFRMLVIPARKVEEPGGGYALQESLFIEFQRGEAVLTKGLFLMRKFARDRKATEAALKDEAYPWRADAVAWLQSKGSHAKGEFRILKD